eukprot:scaffold46506_cov66-Phaeocystis_antarctica.AAC.1
MLDCLVVAGICGCSFLRIQSCLSPIYPASPAGRAVVRLLAPDVFKPHCNQPCNLQLLQLIAVVFYWQLHTLRPATSQLARDPSLARQEMQANAKPAAAPGDGAPAALVKMSNQHTKLGPARPEEPAPTKLDDQHNTHAMPVRALTMWLPRSPLGLGVHR